MLDKNVIPFLVLSGCMIVGSVYYQHRLSKQILNLERALYAEDKEYYLQVEWYSVAVKDKIKMRESYTDSFQFIFPLFERYNRNHPCSNRPLEINALVNQIAKKTTLRPIRNQEYLSTLDVFGATYKLILATIDSIEMSQKPKEIPLLIIEEFSRNKDSCNITMTPLFSMEHPDSVQVFKYGQLLNITALPFTYNGSIDGLRLITKDGQEYGYH